MNDQPLGHDEFSRIFDLATDVLNGTINDADARELERLVLEDEATRRLYIQIIDDSLSVRTWATDDAPTTDASQDVPQSSTRQPLVQRVLRHDFRIAIVAATLVTLAAIVWSAFTYLPDMARTDKQADGNVTHVALLDGRHNVEWLDGTAPAGNRPRLVPGQRLAIASGLLDIRYRTGARVVIEGPAEFYVGGKSGNTNAESGEGTERSNSGFLKLGRLTARVERPEAKGFTIRTPTMTVQDLGTDFGVSVVDDGATQVRVFEGSVWVQPSNSSLATSGRVLRENEETSIKEGSEDFAVTDASQRKHDFVRAGNLNERVSDDYEKRVLALKPTAYWRMDDDSGLDVTDSGPSRHHGLAKLGAGKISPSAPGKFGSAMNLRGPASGDCAVVKDLPKSTTSKLTVAAWVLAESRPPWAVIAANWGHSKKTGQFFFSLRDNAGDLSAFITQANGEWLDVREGSQYPFPTGRWQHVAFVADGERVRLYRNGVEVASSPYDGTLLASPPANMCIGNRLNDDDATLSRTNWHGSIDELVLLHRADGR